MFRSVAKPAPLLCAVMAIGSVVLTQLAARLGVTWDEFYLAQGGRMIAAGLVPYRDFGTPLGPVIYVVQAFGEWLFPLSLLGYSTSASLLNGITVFFVSYFAIHHLQWSWWKTSCLAVITHCAFFGASGCLWYNQFPVALQTIALVMYWSRKSKGGPSRRNLFWIALASAAALITKPDYAFFGIVFTMIYLFTDSDRLKSAARNSLWFLVLTAAFSILFFVPSVLAGGAPGEWLNIGQQGYDSRLARVPLFVKAEWREFLSLVQRFLSPQILLLLGLCLVTLRRLPSRSFRSDWIWSAVNENPFAVGGLFLALGGVVTKYSSGVGGGYLILHWIPLCFLGSGKALHSLSKVNRPKRFIFEVSLVLVALGSLVLLGRRFQPLLGMPHRAVQRGPMKGLISSLDTVQFFEALDRNIPIWERELGHPLEVYSSGVYVLGHPQLKEKVMGGPLWAHVGTSLRRPLHQDLFHRIQSEPPDVFYAFGLEQNAFTITEIQWEDQSPLIKNWLKDKYEARLSSTLLNLGSGAGGLPFMVTVYVKRAPNSSFRPARP